MIVRSETDDVKQRIPFEALRPPGRWDWVGRNVRRAMGWGVATTATFAAINSVTSAGQDSRNYVKPHTVQSDSLAEFNDITDIDQATRIINSGRHPEDEARAIQFIVDNFENLSLEKQKEVIVSIIQNDTREGHANWVSNTLIAYLYDNSPAMFEYADQLSREYGDRFSQSFDMLILQSNQDLWLKGAKKGGKTRFISISAPLNNRGTVSLKTGRFDLGSSENLLTFPTMTAAMEYAKTLTKTFNESWVTNTKTRTEFKFSRSETHPAGEFYAPNGQHVAGRRESVFEATLTFMVPEILAAGNQTEVHPDYALLSVFIPESPTQKDVLWDWEYHGGENTLSFIPPSRRHGDPELDPAKQTETFLGRSTDTRTSIQDPSILEADEISSRVRLFFKWAQPQNESA
jgi:hypothetical protein